MTIPGLTYVTVTGRFHNASNLEPASGVVRFRMAQRVTNGPLSYDPETVDAELDEEGSFEVLVPATDDPAFSPSGRTLIVHEVIEGSAQLYEIELEGAVSPIDLADIPRL